MHVLDDSSRDASIAHKTSCIEYFICKQIERIIDLYACGDLLYEKVIVHFRWDYVTTASFYIAGYLNKAIWNLSNLCKAIFCPTQICGKIKDVITIFSFHFGHGGHFEIMQIRITYVFGYVLSSMEKIIWILCLQPFWSPLFYFFGFFNNHKYIKIY